MPLRPLYGHEALRRRLAGAIASGRLPQALLLEGPLGVGKQRLALWLAQTVLCEGARTEGEPCGACQPCKLVLSLSHPDVHWIVPIEVARKGADAGKQVDLAEEALADEMAARREQPLYHPPLGLASHGIASARLLSRQLRLTPAMARHKVFVVGDAERLVAQRANPEAANALLKALEEPPADTVLVLTSSEPEALLPTILSRVVRVRVARLPDSVVTQFAQHELGITAQRALEQRVTSAEGSIGRLLAEDTERGAGPAVEAVLSAARGTPADRYALALRQPPFQARGAFTALLDELLERLRGEARAGRETRAVVAAMARVLDARELAQGNVNPQLLAAVLVEDLWAVA
jgi:DNA polymerase III subunit delta'